MKRRGHDFALAHQHRIATLGGQDFDILPGDDDLRGADENHLQRWTSQAGPAFTNGTVNLAAECVALHADVKCSEASLWRILYFLGQKNGPGTGAEGGLAADKCAQF